MHIFKTVQTEWLDFSRLPRTLLFSRFGGYNLRVSTMVAEGVEYFTGTDHDSIRDFDPTHWLMSHRMANSAPGIETTSIEVGQLLGIPVKVDHLSTAGGAVDWTGLRPQEMIDDIREFIIGIRLNPWCGAFATRATVSLDTSISID